ncbi:sigma-54 dependent transcriptional regulator [Chitinimonas sp. BJYL2]|uniref:sigma-54-dependent transcriptional regulator n=1 Tax=Chitinimonas sp. BJYL2 TaxID=2976696 RepID=UPI0022B3882A|nr:sigma 54-interacting transcriptional regulator [Chitinimonas sp. BJYL2]
MHDNDTTQTSPISRLFEQGPPALGLTVLWHPEMNRIGEQLIGPCGPGELSLQRYAPLFYAPGAAEGLPLGWQTIARAGLRIRREEDDSLWLCPPDSRMAIELDGLPVLAPMHVPAARIEAGAVLGLGGAVLLCLHWLRQLPRANPLPGLLGVSAGMQRIRDQVLQVGPTDLTVLLLGETGSGKERVAQALHAASARAALPLVAVNMATLSESLAAAELFGASRGAYTGAQQARRGYFAEAGDGTLFLDEIGDAPASVQPMLLRVLENGEYRPLGSSKVETSQARLIAATDRDLQATGFNQPLLRRLEAFVIRIQPLRQRREDIGLLIRQVLLASEATLVMPLPLLTALCRYDWPGNVRQLQHVVGRALQLLAAEDAAGLAALLRELCNAATSPDVVTATPRPERVVPSALHEQTLIGALRRNRWRIQQAASDLGISRPSLYALIAASNAICKPDQLDEMKLRAAFEASGQTLDACADHLQAPREALRRRLNQFGLLKQGVGASGGRLDGDQ